MVKNANEISGEWETRIMTDPAGWKIPPPVLPRRYTLKVYFIDRREVTVFQNVASVTIEEGGILSVQHEDGHFQGWSPRFFTSFVVIPEKVNEGE